MIIGLFDPYLNGPLGGGERYMLSLAECLTQRGNRVDIFWEKGSIEQQARQKLGLDLTQVNFVGNIFSSGNNLLRRWWLTKKYDAIFYLSDGSLPFLFASKNIIHMQVPLPNVLGKTLLNKIKLRQIKHFVCNSRFTKKTVDRVYGVESLVLYPPVGIEDFSPGKKENYILGVGRFTQAQHAKKQHVLVETFKKLCREGLSDWKLILAGGTLKEDRSYVAKIKKLAKDYPIQIMPDIPFSQLQQLYAGAKIFWHAAGYGEDEQKHPNRMEHFGIVVVEAMAAGCVPVVIGKGGIPEIISDGKNGLLWTTTDQLADITLRLIKSPQKLETLSRRAVVDCRRFNRTSFCHKANEIISQ